MTDYYVKNGGNDSANGLSDANAWETIAKVNASTFSPGDSILFNRGDTWTGTSLRPPSDGSSGNVITFSQYGSGNLPVIARSVSGSGIIANPSSTTRSYLTFEYLKLDGLTSNATGMRFDSGSNNIIVDNCQFADCHFAACYFTGVGDKCWFTNLAVDYCGNGVYLIEGDYHYVAGCTMDYLDYANAWGQDGHAVGLIDTAFSVVENNTLSRGKLAVIAFFAYNGDVTNRNVIRNNTINNTKAYATTWNLGIGSSMDGTGTVDNNIVYGNTINLINRAIQFRGTSDNNRIFHNTIYDANRGLCLNASGSDFPNGTKYMNNLVSHTDIYQTFQEAFGAESNEYDYNLYYDDLANGWRYDGTDKLDFSAWQSANANNDPNSPTPADPLFNDAASGDFTLQGTSPAINAGGWLTTITQATGSGTSFTVDDAGFFFDGFSISGVTGSQIKTENGQSATVTGVDYGTDTLTVDTIISWTQNEGIGLDYNGNAPDIGANEADSALVSSSFVLTGEDSRILGMKRSVGYFG